MSLNLEEKLLRDLFDAERNGSPLTHTQLGRKIQSSTFEDLWSCGCITIKGQEGQLVCFHTDSSEYVLTPSGHQRIMEFITS